jgi:PAS domain S-box-containing protein
VHNPNDPCRPADRRGAPDPGCLYARCVSTGEVARAAAQVPTGVGPADLPLVLHTAPAAILMIDLERRRVVYANAAAMELTGERVSLPVDVDAWGDAAGLTDLGGKRMSETSSPLSLVARGLPVAGEPVAVHDAARRGSSATEAQREASEGRLLWVTGFGLAGGADGLDAPPAVVDGLSSRAMVVFQQMSGTESGDRRRLEVLRDRAVVATDMSFTITDPRAPDDPLIWVNPSFTRLTGYSLDEVVGTNCRLLQGRDTDRAAVRRITAALHRREPITEVLLNYRRDGTAFWNQVSISPVFDGTGELVNFVGVQNDVTERMLVEQERRAALAEAEEARTEMRLLADATTQMTGALDVEDVCTRLARSLVPQLADLVAVDVLDTLGGGPPRRLAVSARDRSDEALLRRLDPDPATLAVLGGGDEVLVADLPDGDERLRLRSMLVVPVRARGRTLGALTLLRQSPYGRPYGRRDRHLALDIAGRAGLTLDNARLYQVEHAAAATLQRSLLPAVRPVDGLQIATRYLVGVDGNQVGGDWYDVIDLPDGAVGMAVGDVVGHDLRAAAAMGQLRGVLRSYAWDGGSPGSVLDRCDQLVQGLEMASMATAVYARLEAADADGTRRLRYANAGHPPPLLLGPGGDLVRLDGHRSPMIGAVPSFGRRDAPGRTEAEVRCAPGSLVVLYTDGLTDIAGEDADGRTALVERTVAALPPGADAQTVVEQLLVACRPAEQRDDVALLAVRVLAPDGPAPVTAR